VARQRLNQPSHHRQDPEPKEPGGRQGLRALDAWPGAQHHRSSHFGHAQGWRAL